MIKKIIISIFVLTTLVCINFLSGCATNYQSQSQTSNNNYKDELNIGHIDFIGYAPLLIAEEKGYLKEKYNIKLKKYDDLGALSKDYMSGKVTAKVNITMSAVNESIEGFNQKIVLVQNYSNGADVIIANKDILDMKGLINKKVGYPKGFLEQFLLESVFKQYGMKLSDATSVDGELDTLTDKITKKEIDAMVLYEPFATELLQKNPDLHVIWSSGSSPGLISDVVTFPSDFVEKHPEVVQNIIDEYFKGVDFLEKNPDESANILIKYFKQTPDEIKNNLKKVVILDPLANRSAFNQNDNIQSIYENVKALHLFLKGSEPSQDFINSFIDARFIK